MKVGKKAVTFGVIFIILSTTCIFADNYDFSNMTVEELEEVKDIIDE